MNFGFKLPEIVRFAEMSGVEYDSARLSKSKKMQIVLSSEGYMAAEEYANEMRKFDIYDLPFEECYFELVFSDSRIGYLCWKDASRIYARSYKWWGNRIDIERYVICVASKDGEKVSVKHTAPRTAFSIPATVRQLELQIEQMEIERQLMALNDEMASHDQSYIDAAIGSLSLGGAVKTAGLVRNASPLRKKLSPEFFTHSVISVPLDRGTAGAARRPGEARAPVRLHWRRGHIRRLPSGNLVKVAPALVGDRRFGAVSSEYLVKSNAA